MTDPPPPSVPGQFFGFLLLVVGVLMTLTCGACTLVVWVGGVITAIETHGSSAGAYLVTMFLVSALFGGAPAVVGALIAWVGFRQLRPRRPPAPPGGPT